MKKKKFATMFSLLLVLFMSTNVLAENAVSSNPDPNIYGQAAISIDLKTNEIIYEKNIDSMMYPASTTKLLTALLLAESKDKNDYLTYTDSAKQQPEYSLNTNLHPISVGDKMTAEDAMYGLLLYSGNDVAYMIADNVGGTSQDFVNKMNEEVKKLKLKNTHFITPNGLHDKDHYTTPYDLSVIARAAYKNEWVQETIGTKKATIRTSSGISMNVENRNKLLGTNGCIGGKTGYTTEAGKCLVAVYERNGRKILGIVMKSVYDKDDTFVFNDMEKVINWSYSEKPISLYTKDSVIKTVSLKYKPLIFIGPEKSIEVPITAKEDITYYDNKVNKSELKENYDLNNLNLTKLAENKSIGTLKITERDSVKSYDLYSTISKGTIIKENILLYLGSLALLVALIAGLILIIKKIKFRRRKNNRRYY